MHLMEIIKLHFKTPLHIGSGKDELDKSALVYHSDSLKSALYATGLPFFSSWEDQSNFFSEFNISSCFPYLNDELFLPRPFGLMRLKFWKNDVATENDKIGKKAKKIAYLANGIFKKWAEDPNQELDFDEKNISSDGSFIFSDIDKVGIIYQSQVQQRVKVSLKNDENSRPFYIDRIYFTAKGGLYFIAQFKNESIRRQVLQALHLLGDIGIGTDRTVGNGLFTFNEREDILPYEMPGKKKLDKKVNLGLYIPKKDEINKIDLSNSSWQLIKRGGYMAGSSNEAFRHLRKNNIYFFSEGSSFYTKEELNGKCVDLRPDWNDESLHPLWRDGQSLFMNL